MPSQKLSALNGDSQSRVRSDRSTVSQLIEMFALPEEMVELLLETQTDQSEKEIRLSSTRIAEELIWLSSFKNGNQSESDEILRAVRLGYHAGYLLKNPNGLSNLRDENLLEGLHEICNSFTPTTTLQRLLLLCEIPLLRLGMQTGTSCHLAEGQAIIDSMTAIVIDDFDGEGMLVSSELSDFAEVLASTSRIVQIVNMLSGVPPLPELISNHFQWSVRQFLLICMGDGRLFGGTGNLVNSVFVELLLKLGGDPSDVRLAQSLGLRSGSAGEFASPLVVKARRPRSAFHSEWAQIAILRSGWGRKRRELAVCVNGTQLEVALQAGGNRVLQGQIESILEVEGVCVEPTGTWIETCWQSDNDADYLEMELEMDDGWRIQRQFCVSRRSGAVLLADVVLGSAPSDVRHTLQVATSISNAKFSVVGEGRELLVDTENFSSLVLPVGLSEWRADRSVGMTGELTGTNGLKLVSNGEQVSALYCPLFFALTPKSADKQFTWRQLVVGNELAPEQQDQAAAARIQVGGRQWLLYRSLAEQANRTFMGQNYASEFVFGEFLLDGKLKPYVDIS
jgi:hypothetical protein